MVWGAILSAAVPALIGAVAGKQQQDSAEEFSASSAAQNRAFQEEMSRTAYQRTMKDMRDAGLNPMLAYSQGPSTVPQGSPAIYPGNVGAQTMNAWASVAGSAAQLSQADTSSSVGVASIKKMEQDIKSSEAGVKQIEQTVINLEAVRQNLIKEGYNLTEQNNVLNATFNKLKAEVPQIASQINLNAARQLLAAAQAKLTGEQSNITAIDAKVAEAVGALGKTAGSLEPVVRILQMILSGPR